jgi:UDP-2,3-diacylglucosamine pyrophosphatase LpxH
MQFYMPKNYNTQEAVFTQFLEKIVVFQGDSFCALILKIRQLQYLKCQKILKFQYFAIPVQVTKTTKNVSCVSANNIRES